MGSNFSLTGILDPLDFSGKQAGDRRDNALRTINQGIDPKFNLTDADGKLKENLRQEGRDFFGRDQLRSIADFSQSSPVAQRLLAQQQFDGQTQQNQLNARNAGNLRNSISTLSARGGVDAGTRARLAAQAQRSNILGSQQLAGNQLKQRNQILSNDANRQLGVLQQLSSLDRADQRADLGTVLKESELSRTLEASRLEAAAQLQNSGGTSFICTRLRELKLMSTKNTRDMCNFMIKSLRHKSRFLYWYVCNMKPVVDNIHVSLEAWASLKKRSVDNVLLAELTDGRKVSQDLYIQICVEIAEHYGLKVPKNIKQENMFVNAFYFMALFTRPQTYKFIYKLYKPKKARRLQWLFKY